MDLAWLWLWHKPVATAPIRTLAWEAPYATGAALEKDQTKKQTNKKTKRKKIIIIKEVAIVYPKKGIFRDEALLVAGSIFALKCSMGQNLDVTKR